MGILATQMVFQWEVVHLVTLPSAWEMIQKLSKDAYSITVCEYVSSKFLAFTYITVC